MFDKIKIVCIKNKEDKWLVEFGIDVFSLQQVKFNTLCEAHKQMQMILFEMSEAIKKKEQSK